MSASSRPLSWESQPSRELVRLTGPLVVSLLSMTILNLVDTLFVGRLGAVALAAVGLGGVASFTVVSFSLALFGAAKVKVGEAFGQGDRAHVERSGAAFLWLALPLGALSYLVGQGIAFGLDSWTLDSATGSVAASYLRVRAFSFPFVVLTSALASWLGAQGETRGPMRAAVLANAINIPLNAWFIFGLDGGVIGGAWATVVAQIIECGLLWFIARPSRRLIALGSRSDALDAFRTGLPTGVERVLDMFAFAAVPLLLARLHPVEVASHQIVLQLAALSFMPLIALSEGASILVSQAIGAGRTGIVRQVARDSLRLTMIYATLCALVFVVGRSLWIGFFTTDPHVLAVAAKTLVAAALLQFINAAYNAIKGILRGLSDFRFVAWVTVGAAWSITPPFTWLVGVHWGLGAWGAWLVLCLEVTCGTLVLVHRLGRHPIFARVATSETSATLGAR